VSAAPSRLPPGAQAYVVGGAVRDRLLGLPALDRDWVVVGTTPQAMVRAGFKPVGRDFPVFLHPDTREEYALARTERKQAAGYHGFAFQADPSVTLEQDLARRDLTINAMAQADHGELVDPYQGQADLKAGVLRHVTIAFAEDPVRILRLARFAARFAHFEVAPETLALMRQMVLAGEVDALVPERVWQEVARGLMEPQPGRMVGVLNRCGALPRLLPGMSDTEPRRSALQAAAAAQAALPVRFAAWCTGLTAAQVQALGQHLRAPHDCQELAGLVAREEAAVLASAHADATTLLALMDHADAWRRADRFADLLQACECRGAPPLERLRAAWQHCQTVDAKAVTQQALTSGLRGPAVGQALQAARLRALTAGGFGLRS
jgi:tRNA nucleotidyltransferase (CCA-adding enzyme)